MKVFLSWLWALFLNTLLGAVFVQFWLLSIGVVGWTFGVMRRSSIRFLWKRRPLKSEESFAEFAAQRDSTATVAELPRWFRKEKSTPGRSDMNFLRRYLGAFFTNLKRGAQGIATTWTLTLPPCALWAVAWWAGWNNSFHKGYEMAPAGPSLWIIGALLFIAAMLYVPMAQARQAATGKWQRFYQIGLIWKLICKRPIRYAFLSIGYLLFSGGVMVVLIAPMFFPQLNPALAALSLEEARAVLSNYYFTFGIFGFLAYLTLKIGAARTYARALSDLAKTGALSRSMLTSEELDYLQRLGFKIHESPVVLQRHFARRVFTRGVTAMSMGFICMAWFGVSFQIVVTEFFHFHPVRGFLNHPLLQVPWFSYLP